MSPVTNPFVSQNPADPDQYLPAPVNTAPPPTPSPPAPGAQPPVPAQPPAPIQDLDGDLVVALSAKPFVILTGPSGTGKSRGALDLAQVLERVPGNPTE